MKKGFTLLELLIVIGIISILVSILTVSYSTAQKKSRDARRQSDLKSAQQIMEQCYAVNNYQYPTITNSNGTLTTTCPSPNNNLTFSIVDPLNVNPYRYSVSNSSVDSYRITTTLETGGAFSVSNQQ